MKKVVAILMVLVFLVAGIAVSPARAARDAGAAAVLSAAMPGVGEWYNRNWQGAYPWGECILGYLCFLVHFSSVIDAANGNTDESIRVDFWSAPVK